MLDAIALAEALREHQDLEVALQGYDRLRRADLHPLQAAARSSMAWFEHVDQYIDRDAVSFAHAMSVRHGGQPPWRYELHLATQPPPCAGHAARSARAGAGIRHADAARTSTGRISCHSCGEPRRERGRTRRPRAAPTVLTASPTADTVFSVNHAGSYMLGKGPHAPTSTYR